MAATIVELAPMQTSVNNPDCTTNGEHRDEPDTLLGQLAGMQLVAVVDRVDGGDVERVPMVYHGIGRGMVGMLNSRRD